jgi:hypothetical protein
LVVAAAMSVTGGLAPSQASAGQVALGAYIPHADRDPSLVGAFAQRAGRRPVVVSSYKRWRSPPFVPAELRAVWSRGGVPLVTWEPWTLAGRGFPLESIAAGRYDRYVRRAAESAAAWGRPILLRFAHEMNGDWYPWGQGRSGNTPGIYKTAWRHLVRIFRSAGADNVDWVWSPNVDGGGQYPFRDFYPGDAWVGWVGLDGFNWARRGEWQSFTELFGDSYEELSRITRRPVIVAETGSSESGGDKAAWLSSALSRELSRFSRVRAVVWFSDPVGGVDFRVNSSPASLDAFRSGIESRRYGLTRSALLDTSGSVGRRAAAPSPPSGGYGQPSLLYRLTQKLHGLYLVIAVAAGLALLLIVALLLLVLARRRRGRIAARSLPPIPRRAGPTAGRRQDG